MAEQNLRARLREEPAPVNYDMALGLARHRALIEAGAQLPAWADELPKPGASWLRRVALCGGTLTVLTLVWARPTPEVPVAVPTSSQPTVEALPTPESAPAVRKNIPTVNAAPAPIVEALQALDATEAREARPLTVEPAQEVERPSAHARRTRGRSVRQDSAQANDSAAQSSGNPRVIAPQDNVELQQLIEAERALSFDPVRALRLAREGELSFRSGYFAQERRYIEVMALFALGRLGEAHAQAAAFLLDYPNAPYRRKVELELLRQPQH